MRISDWSSDVCSSDLDLVRDGDSTANIPLLPGDVIIIPEGFFQGEWHVVYGASASQTISDNIDQDPDGERDVGFITRAGPHVRSEEHTSELQSLMRNSNAAFCMKQKKYTTDNDHKSV